VKFLIVACAIGLGYGLFDLPGAGVVLGIYVGGEALLLLVETVLDKRKPAPTDQGRSWR
jgi:hypothetical protein